MREGGRSRTMTKKELLVHQLLNQAASGNLRALSLALGLTQQLDTANEARESEEVLGPADKALLDQAIRRYGYVKPPTQGEADSDD